MKRDILKTIWQEAGPETLLNIGQGVRDSDYDPIWRGALQSKSPDQLFRKWRRFEKFSHSTNRLHIEETGTSSASFQRLTVDGGIPTTPENLLICGLMIALLEAVGCVDLRCEMILIDGTACTIRQKGQFDLPDKMDDLHTVSWRMKWQDFSPPVRVGVTGNISLPDGVNLKAPVKSLAGHLLADISHPWKVEELAREAGLSKRSLQRQLREAGFSFSSLLRMVRIHVACSLLAEGEAPLTSIAFCTGFSDSAHFSRDFRTSMGMTPTDYRVGWQES